MAYDFTKYPANKVTIQQVPLSDITQKDPSALSIVCSINPESISESVALNIDKVQLINNNLPRSIVSGTKGRTVTFTLLLHGMAKPGTAGLNFSGGNSSTFISAATSLVPFSANIIRGIQTIQDVIGSISSKPEYPTPQQSTNYLNVDKQISDLFKMQVPKDGNTTHSPVKLLGYPVYEGMNFYIENIQVNKKFWDQQLRTMFAEVQITLFQVGKNNQFGRF